MNNTPILPELTDEMTDLEMVEAIDASGVSEELIKRAVAEGEYAISSEENRIKRAVMVASLPNYRQFIAESVEELELSEAEVNDLTAEKFQVLVQAYLDNEERPSLLNKAGGFRFSDKEQQAWDVDAVAARRKFCEEQSEDIHRGLTGHSVKSVREKISKDGNVVKTNVRYESVGKKGASASRYVDALKGALANRG